MKSENKEGTLVIYLEGNILGMQFNTEVMGLITQHIGTGNKNVLFNLMDVKYVDSAGLGLLLNAVSKTKNIGGRLALCNLPEQVSKLLKTTKVESIFLIYSDEAAAITALK
ncbi:MAG: STAS domain-containing protein [Bacteroidetes bacterium]|nr:STAS domain-containing protein [Bacteroidota bacterium]